MKYKVSEIVLLTDGRTVYIFSVDYQSKKYMVCDTDNQEECFYVKETDIVSSVIQI